jgi:hypothetical protein
MASLKPESNDKVFLKAALVLSSNRLTNKGCAGGFGVAGFFGLPEGGLTVKSSSPGRGLKIENLYNFQIFDNLR